MSHRAVWLLLFFLALTGPLAATSAAQESTGPRAPKAPLPAAESPGAAAPSVVERADQRPDVEGGRKQGTQGEPVPPGGQLVPESVPSAPETKPSAATLKLGAGLIVWYYQPFLDGARNRAESFFGRITLDGQKGIWGLHLEPRFRDTKQRSFEDGPVFLQEGYLSAAPGPFTIKVGKSYSKLGLFWDNSFYGNVQVYDGLKLSADYGVSIEALHALSSRFAVGYALQYFLIDGRTNVSLPSRDIVSVPGARRRNELVARIDPELRFGGKNALRFGLSGQLFEADLPNGQPTVLRGAVDLKLVLDGFGLWGEYLYQSGRHVTDFPIAASEASSVAPSPGRASSSNHYGLVGGEYTYGPVIARFNASFVGYRDVDVSETSYVPALGIKPIEELLLLVEYVHWRRDQGGRESFVDRSLNVTAHGFF